MKQRKLTRLVCIILAAVMLLSLVAYALTLVVGAASSKEILKELESSAGKQAPVTAKEDDDQVSMIDLGAQRLRQALEAINVETLTPIEAMNTLYKLKQML